MPIADPARCRRIAGRLDALLRRQLGRGIDPERMLYDALYTRDVLLVCEALRDGDGPLLAAQFRAATAEAAVPLPPAAAALGPGAAAAPRPVPVPVQRPVAMPAPARPARAAPPPWHGEDSLPPTGPAALDSPDTWPPGASEPNLSQPPWTLGAADTRPGTPGHRHLHAAAAAPRRWFQPGRWFGRR